MSVKNSRGLRACLYCANLYPYEKHRRFWECGITKAIISNPNTHSCNKWVLVGTKWCPKNPDSESSKINPDYYQHEGAPETIDVIKAWTAELEGIEAVCTANIIKYISRWKSKNGAEDLRKLVWYAERLIEEVE